jgi:hypothetical protein
MGKTLGRVGEDTVDLVTVKAAMRARPACLPRRQYGVPACARCLTAQMNSAA